MQHIEDAFTMHVGQEGEGEEGGREGGREGERGMELKGRRAMRYDVHTGERTMTHHGHSMTGCMHG